jgi:hypothetical protein
MILMCQEVTVLQSYCNWDFSGMRDVNLVSGLSLVFEDLKAKMATASLLR